MQIGGLFDERSDDFRNSTLVYVASSSGPLGRAKSHQRSR
jgi:hypothetical protein